MGVSQSFPVRRRVGHGDGPLLYGRSVDGAVEALRRHGGVFFPTADVHGPLQPLDARAEVWLLFDFEVELFDLP